MSVRSAGKEETKCLKQGLGAADITGVSGFSVHQRQVHGVEVFWLQWKKRDMVSVHEEAPQQWNFSDIFQVPSHLQVEPVQNIHYCCFLKPWWRETGISTQSVTGSHPHRRNKYLSEQTGIAVWILNKFEYFKNHFSLSLVFTANEEVLCFVSLKWVYSF